MMMMTTTTTTMTKTTTRRRHDDDDDDDSDDDEGFGDGDGDDDDNDNNNELSVDCPLFLLHPSSDSERTRDKKRFLFYLLLWLTPLFTRGSAPLVRATPITMKKIRDCLRSKLSTTKNIYHWYTS